jgi:hypothetical protein
MQLVLLKSRGGDLMLNVQNVAYLRVSEDGQTKIGLVGGDSLLVNGSIDEIAARLRGE